MGENLWAEIQVACRADDAHRAAAAAAELLAWVNSGAGDPPGGLKALGRDKGLDVLRGLIRRSAWVPDRYGMYDPGADWLYTVRGELAV